MFCVCECMCVCIEGGQWDVVVWPTSLSYYEKNYVYGRCDLYGRRVRMRESLWTGRGVAAGSARESGSSFTTPTQTSHNTDLSLTTLHLFPSPLRPPPPHNHVAVSFATAMSTLANDPAEAGNMGTAGRARVIGMFSRRVFVDKLSDICVTLHTAPPARYTIVLVVAFLALVLLPLRALLAM